MRASVYRGRLVTIMEVYLGTFQQRTVTGYPYPLFLPPSSLSLPLSLLRLRPRRSHYRATTLAPRGAGVGLLSLRRARTRRVPYFSLAPSHELPAQPLRSPRLSASRCATPPSSPAAPSALRSVPMAACAAFIEPISFFVARPPAHPRLALSLSLSPFVLPHLPRPPLRANSSLLQATERPRDLSNPFP